MSLRKTVAVPRRIRGGRQGLFVNSAQDSQMVVGISDESYQLQILPQVSRTFALTIPQLPPALRRAVVNAYLLCRIADTIEDEPEVSAAETELFLERFVAVVAGIEPAAALATEVAGRLSQRTLPAERELVGNMERVIAVTATLGAQRAPIQRCIALMCDGMHRFQRTASVRGLPRSVDLDSYCYYVAGVVGEMLTELFCTYSPAIAAQRETLRDLAPSFAQGLQMTNILKDLWEDRSRGACWLPQELFARHGIDLGALERQRAEVGFDAGMRELVGVAHGHLRNALAYSLLIPAGEGGIRRFCLWAIGLAVLTLRRIAANPQFSCGAEVKVSHTAVSLTRISTTLTVRSDRLLKRLLERAAQGLPLAPPLAVRRAAARAAAEAAEMYESRRASSRAAGLEPLEARRAFAGPV
jgi:farnesyl-diphosphate farnesyltransferase